MAGVDLRELQRDSGRKLPVSVIHGLTATRSGLQIQLTLSGGKWVAKSASGGAPTRVKFDQRLKTLESERDGGYTTLLNDALLGASDYPILNAVLGTVVGAGTGGAGLLSGYRPTYVVAYFLSDPYRDRGSIPKGWLIHEDRYELAMSS
jgi:hypothetical protein